MSRPLRHFEEEATYHVICRGNHQQPIFLDEDDRRYFCRLLEKGLKCYGHKVIAYCLMTNHTHMAIRVGEVGLSKIFHRLLFRYAQVFNEKYEMSGHLFQGRYDSKLVDSPQYFRALIRYIHLNPVKAGIVSTAEHYRWSSHRVYLGAEKVPWVSEEAGLDEMELSVAAYRHYVSQGVILDQLDPESVLETERIEILLQAVGDYFGIDPESFRGHCDQRIGKCRSIAALVARRVRRISLLRLAHYLSQVPSSVSKAAKRAEAEVSTSPHLCSFVDRLVVQLESY